jgi:hypothetical protein
VVPWCPPIAPEWAPFLRARDSLIRERNDVAFALVISSENTRNSLKLHGCSRAVFHCRSRRSASYGFSRNENAQRIPEWPCVRRPHQTAPNRIGRSKHDSLMPQTNLSAWPFRLAERGGSFIAPCSMWVQGTRKVAPGNAFYERYFSGNPPTRQ